MKLDQRGQSFSFRRRVLDEHGLLVLRRFTLAATTIREAQREMREVLSRVDRETYVDPGSITIAELCERWLKNGQRNGLWVAKTYHRYAGIVRDHIVPVLGSDRLRTIGPLKVGETLRTWEQRSSANPRRPGILSRRSVHAVYSAFREACAFAVNHQLIATNPCTHRWSRRSQERRRKGLPVEEIDTIVRALAEKWYFPHVVLLVLTGLRRGELFGLRYQDIEFENGLLNVLGVVAEDVDGAYSYRPFPKTSSSFRTISLPTIAVEVLLWLRERFRDDCAAVGIEHNEADFVFPGDGRGGIDNPDRLSSAFSWLIRSRKELPRTSLHNLRHSNARAHLSAGTGIEVIKEILGHASQTTTSNFYLGIDVGVHRKAADNFGDHLAAVSETVRRGLAGR